MNDVTRLPAVAAPIGTAVPYTERDAFELSLRQAKVYASADLVPQQYRDNIPNCLIALNMARRIGADELQVMQNLYIVQGKPGWSGQFLIATFNQCGKFSAIRYEWQSEQGKKDWGCRYRQRSGSPLARAAASEWYESQSRCDDSWSRCPIQPLHRAIDWEYRCECFRNSLEFYCQRCWLFRTCFIC